MGAKPNGCWGLNFNGIRVMDHVKRVTENLKYESSYFLCDNKAYSYNEGIDDGNYRSNPKYRFHYFLRNDHILSHHLS